MFIQCSLRKKMVSATPEEVVRQNMLKHLQQLSFPFSHMAVEVELKKMPHLTGLSSIPNRRADIVCFAKDIHPQHSLYPLVLIECKAIPLTEHVMHQVVGYNHFLKACYLVVANQSEMRLGWYDPTCLDYKFVPYIPSYSQLITAARLG